MKRPSLTLTALTLATVAVTGGIALAHPGHGDTEPAASHQDYTVRGTSQVTGIGSPEVQPAATTTDARLQPAAGVHTGLGGTDINQSTSAQLR